MRHDPTGLADMLRRTATLYETHARDALDWLALDWTQGRAASLEARVTSSGHSDPVSATALAELDRLEREARRTSTPGPQGMPQHPRSVLASWVKAVQVIGLPVGRNARWWADQVRDGHTTSHVDQQLYQSAQTLTDILHLCRPITREVAEKIIGAEQAAALDAGYCQACESPAGPTPDGGEVKLNAGLCRPGCYDIEQRQVRKGVFVDRATTCAEIKAGVTRGEINRPASPLFRTAVPVHHEGDAA